MFDDLSSWYYSNTPQWMGGTRGVPAPTTYGGDANIPVSGFADPGRQGFDSLTPSATQPASGSSADLGSALQALSKSSIANPKEPPPLGAAAIPTGRVGDPARPLKLDALVQLLEKQRAAYGTLSGQPVAQQQVLGLLGF